MIVWPAMIRILSFSVHSQEKLTTERMNYVTQELLLDGRVGKRLDARAF